MFGGRYIICNFIYSQQNIQLSMAILDVVSAAIEPKFFNWWLSNPKSVQLKLHYQDMPLKMGLNPSFSTDA